MRRKSALPGDCAQYWWQGDWLLLVWPFLFYCSSSRSCTDPHTQSWPAYRDWQTSLWIFQHFEVLRLPVNSSVLRRYECHIGFHHKLLSFLYYKLKWFSLFVSTMSESVWFYVCSTPPHCFHFAMISETISPKSCLVTFKNCVTVPILRTLIRWLFRIDTFHDLTQSILYYREIKEGWLTSSPNVTNTRGICDSLNHVWYVSYTALFIQLLLLESKKTLGLNPGPTTCE